LKTENGYYVKEDMFIKIMEQYSIPHNVPHNNMLQIKRYLFYV